MATATEMPTVFAGYHYPLRSRRSQSLVTSCLLWNILILPSVWVKDIEVGLHMILFWVQLGTKLGPDGPSQIIALSSNHTHQGEHNLAVRMDVCYGVHGLSYLPRKSSTSKATAWSTSWHCANEHVGPQLFLVAWSGCWYWTWNEGHGCNEINK